MSKGVLKSFDEYCTCCHKRFLIQSRAMWKYKTSEGYQCSYTCHLKQTRAKGRYRVEYGKII